MKPATDEGASTIKIPRPTREQLTAAVEQLHQRARAVVRLEAVRLLDPDPGQLAPLTRQLIAEAGVLLLADEQLLACISPLFAVLRPCAHSSMSLL
jgi:hypothetical protein